MNGLIRYIKKRVISLILHVFRIFPVNNNRIMLLNELSFSYGDSLKYLHMYITAHRSDLSIVFPARNDTVENAVNVKPMTAKYFKYLMTSRVIVTNAGGISYIPLRRSQLVVNTWHGGGPYKKIGENVNADYWSRKETELNAKRIDVFLSSCRYFTEYELPAMLIPTEKAVSSGLPRNDIFWNNNDDSIRQKVYDFIGCDRTKRIVLYAPTFRGAFESYADLIRENGLDLDVDGVIDALSYRFGGEWVFAIRLHPKLRNVKLDTRCMIDLTDYSDMQELLYTADVVITDYSSLMWDYSLTGKPCFLYAKDIEEYERTRGFYIPVSSWPYPLAHDNSEMVNNILGFNDAEYQEKVKEHHIQCGSFENGNACETVMSIIDLAINGR